MIFYPYKLCFYREDVFPFFIGKIKNKTRKNLKNFFINPLVGIVYAIYDLQKDKAKPIER